MSTHVTVRPVVAALSLIALTGLPHTVRAQCVDRDGHDAHESSGSVLAHPFTDTPDSLPQSALRTTATSRNSPKLRVFREREAAARMRVHKDDGAPYRVTKEVRESDCGDVGLLAPSVALTPWATPGVALPFPTIPSPIRLAGVNRSRDGLFGALLIGAITAGVLGTGDAGTVSGPPVGNGPVGGGPVGGGPIDTSPTPGTPIPPIAPVPDTPGGTPSTPVDTPAGSSSGGSTPSAPGSAPGVPGSTPETPGVPGVPAIPTSPVTQFPGTPGAPDTPGAAPDAADTSFVPTVTATPEPATWMLLGSGLLAVAFRRRRRVG